MLHATHVHRDNYAYTQTIMCTRRRLCVHADDYVYTQTIMCTRRQLCVHADNYVYTQTIMCTRRQLCVHADNYVYTQTIMCTRRQLCVHADNYVYTQTIMRTHRQHTYHKVSRTQILGVHQANHRQKICLENKQEEQITHRPLRMLVSHSQPFWYSVIVFQQNWLCMDKLSLAGQTLFYLCLVTGAHIVYSRFGGSKKKSAVYYVSSCD